MHDKPVIRCLVAYPYIEGDFTEAAVVSLEVAAELAEKGWAVLVDPMTERDLAAWERVQRWFR
jgi:hypothetical protein